MFHSDTKWIWLAKQEEPDEYASFMEKYTTGGGIITLKVAAEIKYIVYVNGVRIGFGQFPGFKNEKYYDVLDITDASCLPENEIRIVVHYEGIDTFTHIKDNAGVIFEVTEGERVLCYSNIQTLGGLDTSYRQHVCRKVTPQIGYSTDMCCGGEIVYDGCRLADLTYNIRKRPVKKLVEGPLVFATPLEMQEKEIYDFGAESSGYIFLQVTCEKDSEIELYYGEHITDGGVRRKVGDRDFSMRFHCTRGHHFFEQLFLRVAGRFVEIVKQEGAVIEKVSLIPVMYPMEETEKFLTGIDAKIYDVSVRTLRLCMHEHYEDCPWREQALYVLDSRNQMLCGYYAFKDTVFARANIVYMSKGIREDGMLELTFPAVNTPTIPFFTLMYPVVVWEYIMHTKDMSILEEVMPTLKIIMEKFESMLGENHLISNTPDLYWNFYEWSKGSDGNNSTMIVGTECEEKCDLIINCALVYAAERYLEICDYCGFTFSFDFSSIRQAIKNAFYNEDTGMYFLSNKTRNLYSQLGNAFAKLAGLEGWAVEMAIRGQNGVIPATLSMLSFVYEAIGDDSEESKQFILADIRKNYEYMLGCGATSFWETLKGQSDFSGAGSLCHGWSAIPIYYYHKLLKKECVKDER